MVKAVLFGSLSTLANLVELERKAFNRAFHTHGIDVSWEELDYEKLLRAIGRFSGPSQAVNALLGEDTLPFYEDLERHFHDLIDETRLQPHRWTEAALDQIAQQRNRPKVALVSGAARQTVLRVLAAVYPHRASAVFDVVTTEETAPAAKPSPALYNAALNKLDVRPSGAIAIEATQHGLIAAQAAGVAVAGYRGRYSGGEEFRNADFELVDDLERTLDLYRASQLKRSIAAE